MPDTILKRDSPGGSIESTFAFKFVVLCGM
jgi:hypothetical protein